MLVENNPIVPVSTLDRGATFELEGFAGGVEYMVIGGDDAGTILAGQVMSVQLRTGEVRLVQEGTLVTSRPFKSVPVG